MAHPLADFHEPPRENSRRRGYPRWLVAGGLVLYCSFVWIILFNAAGALADATKWLGRTGVEVASALQLRGD
ncbi:MAG: hypothetical protein AB7O04_16325 [Hyphomonadaceae bacterium]